MAKRIQGVSPIEAEAKSAMEMQAIVTARYISEDLLDAATKLHAYLHGTGDDPGCAQSVGPKSWGSQL